MPALTTPSTPLAAYLRERREAAGLTQQAVAILVGVRQATLSRWETGDGEPSLAALCALETHIPGMSAVEAVRRWTAA